MNPPLKYDFKPEGSLHFFSAINSQGWWENLRLTSFFYFLCKVLEFSGNEGSIMVYFFPRVSRNFTRDPWRGNTIYLHIVAKSQVQVFCLIFCHFKDLGQIFPSKVSTNPIPFRDSQNFYCAVPILGSASHLFKRYWLSNWKIHIWFVCFCFAIWKVGFCRVGFDVQCGFIGQWDSWSFCGPWGCVYTTQHSSAPANPAAVHCAKWRPVLWELIFPLSWPFPYCKTNQASCQGVQPTLQHTGFDPGFG